MRFFFFLSLEEFEFEFELELEFEDEFELELAEELELELDELFDELLDELFEELLPATWKAPSLTASLGGASASPGGVLATAEVPASALMPAAATAIFQGLFIFDLS